jgi:hypothetical protein
VVQVKSPYRAIIKPPFEMVVADSKYFGVKKGITNYSLISDMFDELNFLLQSGASKDSMYLPQCILTTNGLEPKRNND